MQGIFAIFGRFVCSRGTTVTSQVDALRSGAGGQDQKLEESGPGWLIIIAFTMVFLGTYPLHMYVAEIYLKHDFTFLLVKYFLGFLYLILIPMITLIAQKEIRQGVWSVLTSPRDNNDDDNFGSCELLDELPAAE